MPTSSASLAARKIATVARIPSYLGWPFLVLWGAMAAFSLLLVPMALILKTDDPNRWWAIAAVPVCFALAMFAYLYVRTAKRMRARDPGVDKFAQLLLLPLLLGFPIFTIVSLYCFVLLSHYPAYLYEAD
jgi:hypothetical protein